MLSDSGSSRQGTRLQCQAAKCLVNLLYPLFPHSKLLTPGGHFHGVYWKPPARQSRYELGGQTLQAQAEREQHE